MPDNEDSETKSNQVETSCKAEDEPEEGAGSNRRHVASFSMAHALSMVRRRQQEQQRAQQEQESVLEQERKEKARAKRQRRRQNQKLAKAKSRLEQGAEIEHGQDEQSMECTNKETCDKDALMVPIGTESEAVLHPSDAIESTRGSARLPPKKRIKLSSGDPTISKSSSIAASPELCGAENEAASSSASASQNAIKLRSLVPRAVMLKKPGRS